MASVAAAVVRGVSLRLDLAMLSTIPINVVCCFQQMRNFLFVKGMVSEEGVEAAGPMVA